MRVYLGSDHAGLEFKRKLVPWLTERGHEPVDHGARDHDPEDDYPPYVLRVALSVVADPGSAGIVLGGSGNGEVMAANKVAGVRAILAWNEDTARLGREHNDANVLSLGARMHDTEEALRFVDIFLTTPYSQDERHSRRLDEVRRYEESGELPEA